MDLQAYAADHIASFLLNYELLVRDLAEVAAHWPNLDDEERGHYRAELLQTWGNRKVLGQLFKARRLQPAQEARLADLDRQLFGQAMRMEQCFDLDLHQLLAIFRWAHRFPCPPTRCGLRWLLLLWIAWRRPWLHD